ncbi:DivIVA domain-containing protein [Asanoa siamensis]|uniref:Cell wall synthesis protein Wag31 n=1 Tax=Asanoa siamensis TaxID=926357 RepID=A0ABQ4CYT3_9ACTN|nr:DivIVA domain-containing protein [Asanoa siamensis]GIF76457.1 cell wall synthesis protein Wag31 [Asanoa siamensis]
MPLTPADIHNIAFGRPSIGKRGYDEEEVDAFLDSLEQELVRLIEENYALRAAAARETPGGGTVDPRLATAVDELSATLDRLQAGRHAAVQAARALEAELSEARAARPPAGSGPDLPQMLTMAERSAETHISEARREADDLLSSARETAQQITGQALSKAAALERDARRRHQESVDAVAVDRAATQQQIAELEKLGREYRAMLKAHMDAQMRLLMGRDQ